MAMAAPEEAYEEQHVHSVYQQIASHFSETRYRPWPIVDRFIHQIEPGSVGLDIGCGNGKYLKARQDIFILASDRSEALISIAKTTQPHSTLVADALNLPHPPLSFDFAISIAVIHHLSARSRRIEAIRSMLELLKSKYQSARSGKLLLVVWALEQESSRRGWGVGDDQDVLVPWILKSRTKGQSQSTPLRYDRYYHLYRKGELESDIAAASGTVQESGYEKDNWWAVCCPESTR